MILKGDFYFSASSLSPPTRGYLCYSPYSLNALDGREGGTRLLGRPLLSPVPGSAALAAVATGDPHPAQPQSRCRGREHPRLSLAGETRHRAEGGRRGRQLEFLRIVFPPGSYRQPFHLPICCCNRLPGLRGPHDGWAPASVEGDDCFGVNSWPEARQQRGMGTQRQALFLKRGESHAWTPPRLALLQILRTPQLKGGCPTTRRAKPLEI